MGCNFVPLIYQKLKVMNKLFIIFISLIALSSCQKDTELVPTPVPTKNLAKFTYVWNNGTPESEEFTYDAQGRVAVIISDEQTSTFNYVSASSLVVTAKNNIDNSPYRSFNCTLNSKGYITKISMINPDGTLYYTYNYTYSPEDYIIKTEGIPPSGVGFTAEYTIQNGNVVSSKNFNGGALSYTGQYNYDNSLVNKTGFGHTGYWYSNKLFGKGLKNMLVDYKSFSPNNTLTWHMTYEHELDADGYPLSTTSLNVLQNKKGIETYVYK
jgi:hypothetical protein